MSIDEIPDERLRIFISSAQSNVPFCAADWYWV